MSKNTNIVRIPTTLDSNFFRYWFNFLEPFHKLTNREIDVITCFIKHRFDLSKVIKDDNILDQVLMSEETKKIIRLECKLESPYFQVIMGKLKQNRLIVDGKINKRFIPNVEQDAEEFRLIFHFDLNGKRQ